VRSSAASEDTNTTTMAGYFKTIANVSSTDLREISLAIDNVAESYRVAQRIPQADDQVIVQSMIKNVSTSGVIFTNDLNTGAPYYVINYDDQSGKTDSITSGTAKSNRTLYVHKSAYKSVRSTRFRKTLLAVMELENVTGNVPIDIEFALDLDLHPYLFQVRPITVARDWDPVVPPLVNIATKAIQETVSDKFRPIPGVFGQQSIFGQMPDWNPAEIIGRTPRLLALSLYCYLITDNVWRRARQKMGYQVPPEMPLLTSLQGQPFIDVRLSLHSFLPSTLSPNISEKLVDNWINRLINHPTLHDKIEFEIAITCFSFDFDSRVSNQWPHTLTDSEHTEFKELHRTLTSKLIRGQITSVESQLASIDKLAQKFRELPNYSTPKAWEASTTVLNDCIELGTLSFAILARHAFIGQSLLRSLATEKLLSNNDIESFMLSVHTVAQQFAVDSRRVQQRELARQSFLAEYGHLRPGTYDILSPRYDKRPSLLGSGDPASPSPSTTDFLLSDSKLLEIDRLLERESLQLNANQLFDYIRTATEAREYAKFIFTRHLSYYIELLASWGNQHNLTRNELSHLTVQQLLRSVSSESSKHSIAHLKQVSEQEQENHRITQALRLPEILFDEQGVYVIPFQVATPNFITQKIVSGRCVRIDTNVTKFDGISGSIVLIESADPGFDWIFSHNIKGLITKYGGTNSHMAIRCAEFGIAAAIGTGEQIFKDVFNASAVEINCAEKHIQTLAHLPIPQ
jgi:phosphohistidine swiveling domain-containing protein